MRSTDYDEEWKRQGYMVGSYGGLTLCLGTWGKASLHKVLEEKQKYEVLREYEEAEGEEGKWLLWAPFSA